MNKLRYIVLTVAIAACLAIQWIEAQKTVQSTQQQQWNGSGQNAVYGGYGQAVAPSSPARRQQQQQQFRPAQINPGQSSSSSSRFVQQSIRQQGYQQPRPQPLPVVQQEQQSAYSSTYEQQQQQQQQAEADAEPASYGK